MKNKFEILYDDIVCVPEIGKFPGGEIRVRVPKQPAVEVLIIAYVLNSDDVMTLVMLVNALRNMGVRKIRLTLPYVPYARQDRVCNVGEAFSIRAFANIINSLEFASVVVWDAHSQVSIDSIDRCINVPQKSTITDCEEVLKWIAKDAGNLYIVSPDEGSTLKSKEIAKTFHCKGVIFAEKERELSTGKIIRTVVKDLPADIAESRLLVVDDICDGGRTFIELAKVLRPYCKEMSLYVTHGIFSQGLEVFEPFYDNVWCSVNFKDFQ